MKGIILAGGNGTRLKPLTNVISKQLLPVYDKPMIFYPIQTLKDMGIDDMLIITAPNTIDQFVRLLGDGSSFEANFNYAIQPEPKGIAQAITIGKNFVGDSDFTLILGDNIFTHKLSIPNYFKDDETLGRIFIKEVPNPNSYGVVEFSRATINKMKKIHEKPKEFISSFAVVGIYQYEACVSNWVHELEYSSRGELEITDLNNSILSRLEYINISEQTDWYDAGTIESLYEASTKIRSLNEFHKHI